VIRDRMSRVLGVVTVLLLVGASLLLAAMPVSAADLPDGWTTTKYGPLGPPDRDLLIKVRLAGLWEMPAGDQAQRRAVDPKVREIGAKIAAEHNELDRAVIAAAAQLGVDLPDAPNSNQRDWLNEMDAADGAEFDRIFIDRLRAAHGSIFPAIGYVRAGTRNDLVRSFAATSNAFVLRHMGYLESSGLVDWDLIPAPPDPYDAAEVTRVAGLGSRSINPVVIWAVLIAALVAGLATAARVIKAR
jgi:predicted outer membrane protein